MLVEAGVDPLSVVVAAGECHDTKLLHKTLESVVVERPVPSSQRPQHLCLDKGYDNPTGHKTALRHRYEPHIRRIGEEKLDRSGQETLSRAAVGGGANIGLAVKVSWNPGEI